MTGVIPDEMANSPFMVSHAHSLGFTWADLQTEAWSRLSRGQYVAKELTHTDEVILRGVELRMPSEYAFSGRTAAWFLDLEHSLPQPIEVTIPRHLSVRARAGVKLRRASLTTADVVTHRGFRITCPLRTIRDLGSGRDFVQAPADVDMALHAELVARSDLLDYVQTHPGEKGIKRLRRVARFADQRTESPMESRLRGFLIKARLPVPEVQTNLHDRSGRFVARVDLCYPRARLAVEYDGENHKDRFVSDLRR